MSLFGASEYSTRSTEIEGVDVDVASYRLGNIYVARVYKPGEKVIGRGSGTTRLAAESEALDLAQNKIANPGHGNV